MTMANRIAAMPKSRKMMAATPPFERWCEVWLDKSAGSAELDGRTGIMSLVVVRLPPALSTGPAGAGKDVGAGARVDAGVSIDWETLLAVLLVGSALPALASFDVAEGSVQVPVGTAEAEVERRPLDCCSGVVQQGQDWETGD
jgi:hypothetical protein